MEIAQVKDKVQGWLNEKFETEPEYFLVDIKLSGNKLQVFIDGDRGMTIDKCADVSRYLEKFLDVEKILGEKYILEVSSPGMDNPFKVLRQYENKIGRAVNVLKTDGQRVEGILVSAGTEKITLEKQPAKGQEKNNGHFQIIEIPFSEIKNAKLNFNF